MVGHVSIAWSRVQTTHMLILQTVARPDKGFKECLDDFKFWATIGHSLAVMDDPTSKVTDI